VLIKTGVVLFVIGIGAGYVMKSNWTEVPFEERILPQRHGIRGASREVANRAGEADRDERARKLERQAIAKYAIDRAETISRDRLGAGAETRQESDARVAKARQKYAADLPTTDADRKSVDDVLAASLQFAKESEVANWGMMAKLGVNEQLAKIDDSTRTKFVPYGVSGIMLGAALVFFAFIGFDSISTHAEEAVRPNRDVPFGIIASLVVCTLLYIGVSSVITGMKPYPEIDTQAAVARAFSDQAEAQGGSIVLKSAAILIAVGGLAGMTSVLLITMLSQARIFLAMARDGFLPHRIFGTVHEKYKTPHISTIVMGIATGVVAAFTPIQLLEKMVNIGTLFAFTVVCAAVLLLRIQRPDARRPFRCPAIWIVAPAGIVVNIGMAMFLPVETWERLVIWLAIGLVIYFCYGFWNSALRRRAQS
jgi:hypothetical protein